MDALDDLLARADPAAHAPRLDLDERLRSLPFRSGETRRGQRGGRWRRPMIVLGAVGAVSLALVGAAIFSPLRLWIDHEEVPIDLRVPIEYTTASGANVQCTVGLSFGSAEGRTPAILAAIPQIEAMDWTGIGQKIYDYAIEHPHTEKPGETWTDVTPESRDTASFFLAMTAVFREEFDGILPEGAGAAQTSDCAGRLS